MQQFAKPPGRVLISNLSPDCISVCRYWNQEQRTNCWWNSGLGSTMESEEGFQSKVICLLSSKVWVSPENITSAPNQLTGCPLLSWWFILLTAPIPILALSSPHCSFLFIPTLLLQNLSQPSGRPLVAVSEVCIRGQCPMLSHNLHPIQVFWIPLWWPCQIHFPLSAFVPLHEDHSLNDKIEF